MDGAQRRRGRMTVVPCTADGVGAVGDALRAGDATVLPCPSPLPYVVAARNPVTVNRAKRRPDDRPCGLLVSPDQDVFAHLDLTAGARDFARWAASVELVNLLVPVKDSAPGWLRSSAVGGFAGLSTAWHARLYPLAEEFGHLHVSSANRTATPAAVTARYADAAFAGSLLTLNGDSVRDQTRRHGSAVMLQIHRDGEARVVRDGVQNQWCPDPDRYLRWLRRGHRAHHAQGV